MKKISIGILGTLVMATGLFAKVPYAFNAGTPAKASEVNANFKDLSDKLDKIKGGNPASPKQTNYDPYDGTYHVKAQVNGVEMTVITDESYRHYTIETPAKSYIRVNHNGEFSSRLYYQSDDCSGQPYISGLYDDEATVGKTYLNPKLQSHTRMAYDGENLLYDSKDDFVQLHYQSSVGLGQGTIPVCYKTTGATVASKALPNDPAVTGISSYPLHITGAGSPITITGEVGSPATQTWGDFEVYAAGVKIGYTNSKPDSRSQSIWVYLDGGDPNKGITLRKDGTFNGSNYGEELVYASGDCIGNAYVRVLNNYDTEWWSSKDTKESYTIKNAEDYYILGDAIYKMSSGPGSIKSSEGHCNSDASNYSGKIGYRLATKTSNPYPDRFATPITIEGYDEEVKYNALSEAE